MACKNCGRCCGYVALEIRPESVPWLELHGVPLIDRGGVQKLVLNVPCKWRDEKSRRCTHYGERPPICRNYLCDKAKGD